jgi:holo-[acyl-carrier protein] synthase
MYTDINIGIDIVNINRIKVIIQRRKNFLERFFSVRENEYFSKKNKFAQTVAGHFAAKEAFVKAFHIGFSEISLKEIEILHVNHGAPIIFYKNKEIKCSLSITHDGNFAIAAVILQK